MKKTLENGSQQLWEYFVVAYPDENVNSRIMNEKGTFFETYKQGIAAKSKCHITIANFMASETMEETVIRWIQRICTQYKGFLVTLNNYSGFPPHTIYLRIQDQAPFRQLAEQLKVVDEYVQSNGCPPAHLTLRPHLTIADGLESNVYNKAMLDYSQKTFHETFMLRELVLLKRINQFDAYSQVNIFRFYPPDTNMYNQVA